MPPPRTLAELQQPVVLAEQVLPVASARVVFADHDLLRHDFPWLAGEDDAGLARWLLGQAAVISAPNAGPSQVNSPIHTVGSGLEAYRPPRYGRAVVRPVSEGPGAPVGGLLDIKGAGVAPGRVPHHGELGNGLLLLARALSEYVLQGLIEAIFRHTECSFHTLPVYGVLDLGFDILMEPGAGSGLPAGALVRRAHRRVPGGNELPKQGSSEHQILLEIELLLRHYGVTSEGEPLFRFVETSAGLRLFYRETPVALTDQVTLRALREAASGPGRMAKTLDGTNIQTAHPLGDSPVRALLVDFGQYEIRPRFEDPLVSLVFDRPFLWGGLICPEDSWFVQPRPELAVPDEEWGVVALSPDEVSRVGYPASYRSLTRIEHLCLDLANGFRRGELAGCEVQSRLEALISRAASIWPRIDCYT